MPAQKEEKKVIELWEGKEVEVKRIDLLKDFDYISELNKAIKEQDVATSTQMLFALIGDDNVFNEVREHIIEEKGIFDVEELGKVTQKIFDLFPKAQSSSSKRW